MNQIKRKKKQNTKNINGRHLTIYIIQQFFYNMKSEKILLLRRQTKKEKKSN